MTINVTEKHIREGHRSLCGRCPIALALLSAFPNADEVSAGPTDLYILRDEKILSEYSTPKIARVWMLSFDLGKPVQPFSFDLP